MRIVVIGQAAFGEQVLKRLLENGEEVVGASAPETPAGGRPDPLRALAEERGLPVCTTKDLKLDEVYQAYAALKPDINVMAFVTDILAERVLAGPSKGTIQYHPSLLPKHRGASAMNWAIAQGKKQTGLTIFWPDKGIDTGPVLLQKEVPIEPDDTLGSLYFGKLFPMGIDAIAEAVELVKNGKAPSVAQDESQATYEGLFEKENAMIDWQKPAQEVYDLVRGSNPQPGAHTIQRGRELSLFDCKLDTEPPRGLPGRVTGIDHDHFIVALNGGSLLVYRVQPEGSGKLTAAEYIAVGRINSGETLGE